MIKYKALRVGMEVEVLCPNGQWIPGVVSSTCPASGNENCIWVTIDGGDELLRSPWELRLNPLRKALEVGG